MKLNKNALVTTLFAGLWIACSTEDPMPQSTPVNTLDAAIWSRSAAFFGDHAPVAVPDYMTQLSHDGSLGNNKIVEVVQVVEALRRQIQLYRDSLFHIPTSAEAMDLLQGSMSLQDSMATVTGTFHRAMESTRYLDNNEYGICISDEALQLSHNKTNQYFERFYKNCPASDVCPNCSGEWTLTSWGYQSNDRSHGEIYSPGFWGIVFVLSWTRSGDELHIRNGAYSYYDVTFNTKTGGGKYQWLSSVVVWDREGHGTWSDAKNGNSGTF